MIVNLLPFICEAFSVNRRVYKLIDDLYKKDTIKFYNSAKQSEWYIHPISKEGSLEQEEYFKKALGIFLNAEGYENDIDNILKKGWHYAYNYVKSNDFIITEKFLNSLIKKFNGLDNITDDEMNSNILALIFLGDEKVDKESEAFVHYMKSLEFRLVHYRGDCKERVNYNNISQNDFERIRNLKNQLSLQYGNFRIMNGHINNEELRKYISMVDCLFDYENVSLISMCDSIKFTDRDIEEILYLWIMGNYDKTKSLEDAAKFLISMTRLKNFSKAYMAAKKYHFEHNQENVYIELDIVQKENFELKTNISIEHRKVEELNQKVEKLKNEKDAALIEKIAQLEKENRKLQEQIHEEIDNKIEINSLREFIFNLDNIDNDVMAQDRNFEDLKSIKALIVGGTTKWQQRMKDLLPGFNFVAPDALNFDVSIIDKVDYVFIYTNYLGHAMYYKVVSNIKNKKVFFLKATNEERVLYQIKNSLKDF